MWTPRVPTAPCIPAAPRIPIWRRGRTLAVAGVFALAATVMTPPRAAHAGSGRTILGVAAGAVLGAAVLGAIAQSQAARPPQAPPRKQAKAPKPAASKQTAAKTTSGSNMASSAEDPFAASASQTVPTAAKP